jgi:hypothetical protein
MIDKIESRTKQWCNKWITLGGRLTLVKFVLEAIHVYWKSIYPKMGVGGYQEEMF